MIEQAQQKHIPFVTRRLSPFKHVTEDTIIHIFGSSSEVVFVNPEKEVVCRIHHDIKKRENHVAWLLPANENRFDLYLVMAKTFVEVSHRFPQHDDFTTWARFKDGKGCISILTRNRMAKQITGEWHSLFPNSTQVKWRWWDNSWIISARHGDLVSDVVDYLNRPKGAEHDSALYSV